MSETAVIEPVALSASQVAQMLGVSTRSVWRMLASGELPQPRQVGQRKRWDKAELLDWWRGQPEARR